MFKSILIFLCVAFTCTFVNAVELSAKLLSSAFKPTFVSSEGNKEAGTAFVVMHKENFYAVTAHHLFSEAGGFSREHSWKELGYLVSKVNLQCLSNKTIKYSAGRAVSINGAKSVSNRTGKNDIAIFKMNQKPNNYLKVAKTPPKIGEVVWLYGLVYNRPEKLLLHEAVVVKYNKNWISYQFKDPGLILNGTSGAAILNQSGEVIGINLSGGDQNGKLYGYGNPLSSIQEIFNKSVP